VQPYPDREAAGRALAGPLARFRDRPDALVLGLPRGGVPVAAALAGSLRLDWDVLLVRKLTVPGLPELAMGAVALLDGRLIVYQNPLVRKRHPVPSADFEQELKRQERVLRERDADYRRYRTPRPVVGRLALIVDDGLATGSTMQAAVRALPGPARIVVVAPIGSPQACRELAATGVAVSCPWQPGNFSSVSQGYLDFAQLDDRTVHRILAR